MAWSLVANTAAGGTDSSVTTSAIDTTGATLLVLSMAKDANNNPVVLSDSKGNTWNMISYANQGACRNVLYYSRPTSVGSGHTFSNTGGFNYSSLAVAAFSGNAPYLILDRVSSNNITSTTIQPGSITPSQDNELVICSLGFSGAGTPISIDGGFTETNELDFSSGAYYGNGLAYLIQTTAAAANPTWTRTNSSLMTTVIASFKLSPELSGAWLRG